ncbi:MAG TPA: hypothetical protein VEG35_05245, partial [Burkholderiales bacterium]|nr:hypothetical protein [Burkholderiales bacterium]
MPRPTLPTPFLALGLSLLASAAPARPQATPSPQTEKQKIESPRFTVSRAASKVKVDALLDEEAWASATVIPLPFEWTPGDNIPSPVKTECLVTYDTN